MSDEMQGVQMEGLSRQESEETVSVLVEGQAFKINKRLLFRRVPVLSNHRFPLPFNVDVQTFDAFLDWLHEDKLPALHGIYHEDSGKFTYAGYNPDTLYRLVTHLELGALADNIMDCIAKAHVSVGVGFSKDEITKIYIEQDPHWGLALFTAYWIHLEDTRPNDYMKVTTKADREDLLNNETIAIDVRLLRGPLYVGSHTKCRYHLHNFNADGTCPRAHSTDICLWVMNKDGDMEDMQSWRTKKFLDPVQTQSD
ncbi:hypothetical protein EAE99_008852 [Botrytis elliptica]|nr:hypothetical protein EAE99_008852 [Botrytis elliptica]